MAVIAGAVLLALQRYGHRLTAQIAARLLPRAAAQTAAVGAMLDAIHATRARVALSERGAFHRVPHRHGGRDCVLELVERDR